jgi:hypothetical protein
MGPLPTITDVLVHGGTLTFGLSLNQTRSQAQKAHPIFPTRPIGIRSVQLP